NAIGKAAGAWNLGPNAGESQRGFLLNHVITDELPSDMRAGERMSNSDPITGQAGWYDVRVRIYRAEADATTTLPQFAAMHPMPGSTSVMQRVQAYFAGKGEFAARLKRAAMFGTTQGDALHQRQGDEQ
ncbi:MAG: formate dehydrogenase, partial [Trinickia sp.]